MHALSFRAAPTTILTLAGLLLLACASSDMASMDKASEGQFRPVGAQDLLSYDAFADAFIREFSIQAPDLKVRKVGTLELKVEGPDGGELTTFLDNAYREYRASPESLTRIAATYVAALREAKNAGDRVDISRVVPVIKDVSFFLGLQETLKGRGDSARKSVSPAHEPYNAELVILFAEDTELNVRYLSEEDLTKSGFPAGDRRARAVDNLKALLPKIEVHGEHGTYVLSAGGYYEASLLLFNEFWESGQLPVQGELVVAIPARDVLVITGSQDSSGLEAMRRIISDVMNNAPYTLTDQLFVYRDRRFVPFGS